MRYKVLLVDDHPLVRRGVADVHRPRVRPGNLWRSRATWPKPCRPWHGSAPTWWWSTSRCRSGHGIDLIEKIKVHDPRIKTLVSSMHDETLFAERVLQAGAMGYITKQEPPEALVRAIRQVLRGELYLSPRMTSRHPAPA